MVLWAMGTNTDLDYSRVTNPDIVLCRNLGLDYTLTQVTEQVTQISVAMAGE